MRSISPRRFASALSPSRNSRSGQLSRQSHYLGFAGGRGKDVLARRASLAGSLSAETGGDLALSPRWGEVMHGVGIGDVAVVTCRDALGCWGWVEAYRDGGDRPFSEEEIEFLAGVGASLGAAMRRGLGFVTPTGADSPDPSPTGVIVLSADLRVVSVSAGARDWIGAFPLADLFAAWGMLPAVVYPLATRVRAGGAAAEARALDRLPTGGG